MYVNFIHPFTFKNAFVTVSHLLFYFISLHQLCTQKITFKQISFRQLRCLYSTNYLFRIIICDNVVQENGPLKTIFESVLHTWNAYKSGVIREDTIYIIEDVAISDFYEISSTAGVTSENGTIRFNVYQLDGDSSSYNERLKQL